MGVSLNMGTCGLLENKLNLKMHFSQSLFNDVYFICTKCVYMKERGIQSFSINFHELFIVGGNNNGEITF